MLNNQKLTTIYLVRHGETEWNVKRIVQGHLDSSLTPDGIKQGKILGEKLKHIDFAGVFASDLFRAHHTAQLMLLEKKLAIKTTQALRERNFGKKYQGKSRNILNEDIRKYFEKYKNITDAQRSRIKLVSDMESIEESIARVLTFLREIAVGYKGKNVLLVTHGGVMRHLLIHLGFGNNDNLTYGAVSNNAVIILQSDGVDFFIKETSGINKVLNKE